MVDVNVKEVEKEYERIATTPIGKMAEYFHDTYEFYAKEMQWDTQKDCRVKFDALPEKNRKTMILTTNAFMLNYILPLLIYIRRLRGSHK